MEHKLIQGGEQYLPFARSRIKAMRATGAKYASQRFVLPDATVNVQIVADQEYIRIEGNGARLALDSGVVDVLSIASANPALYLAGTLSEAGSAQAYNALFVGTPWRKNSSEGAAGQLSGAISSVSPFLGQIFDSVEAPSFRPARRAVTPATVPPTTEPEPADAALADKKTLAISCPASIFTGRCRLYVQALYGRPLHKYGSATWTPAAPPTLTLVSGTSAAPALMIPTYKPAADGQQTMLLDTSCGIWLDPSDGKHYLIQANNNVFKVFPMKAPAAVEQLRKALIDATPGALNATDKEHLEAYILAYSLPDAKSATTAGGFGFGAYSMGYGWHWNWTGDRADIVINNTYDQGSGNFAMESTHYRAALTKSEFGTFSVLVTTVEGPVRWAVARAYWTIVEPDYSDFTHTKTTPKLSGLFAGGGPFYAFYKKDALQMCRVDVSYNEGVTGGTVENNCFGGQLVTLGLTEGDRTTYGNGAAYFAATFTCGPVSSGSMPYLKSTPVTTRNEVRKKKFLADWGTGLGTSPYGLYSILTSDDYGLNFQTVSLLAQGIDSDQRRLTGYEIFFGTGSRSDTGYVQVVVPFNDAEAIFLRATNQQTNTWTFTSVDQYVGTKFHSRDYLDREFGRPPYDPVFFSRALYNGAYASSGNTFVSSDTTLLAPTTVTTVITEKLVAGGSTQNATFDRLSEFTNNAAETVNGPYAVWSGTSTDAPVVISNGHLDPPVGMYGVVPVAPVIVGWV
jgi:hypothetical protein